MSFWYSIYYDLSTSASWKIKEKSKILGTFPDTFFKMATDIIFHRFWVELDSILGCFLVLKSEKWRLKNIAKTYLQKSHAGNPDHPDQSRDFPLWSLKRIQGFQDWQPNTGIMTLHWCLAARWRIRILIGLWIDPLVDLIDPSIQHFATSLYECRPIMVGKE